jgi:restriction endonuclease Mrr
MNYADNMPSGNELELALLDVLLGEEDGMNTDDIFEEVAIHLGLSNEILQIKRSGRRSEFGYRLSWARTKAKEKGLVERVEFGIWKITKKGEDFVQNPQSSF